MEYGWTGLSDQQKFDGFGMRPTKDLLARGQACTECHVGLGSTDVNHDLIAAGHPRLNFEYGNQLAKLPKHWRVEDDKARHPDYEAKVWALGQLLDGEGVARPARVEGQSVDPRRLDQLPGPSSPSIPASRATTSWSRTDGRRRTPRSRPRPGASSGGPGICRWPRSSAGRPEPRSGTARFVPWAAQGRDDPAACRTPSLVARRAHAASEELGRLAESLNRGRIAPGDPGDARRALTVDEASNPSTGTGRPGNILRSWPLIRRSLT